jgi:hypothetical protein
MNKQDIQTILIFLERADLKGSEAPTFNKIATGLVNLINSMNDTQILTPIEVNEDDNK